MAAIGSLVFCTDCGDLLEASSGDTKAILICTVCGTENKGDTKSTLLSMFACDMPYAKLTSADTSSTTINTKSKPSAFPSLLRSTRSAVQSLTKEDIQPAAMIKQTCPQCGKEEMRYYTLQLRSADEGSTVFYTCEDCGYKYDCLRDPLWRADRY